MSAASQAGAYRLWIELRRGATLRVGSLGRAWYAPGLYLYVGSARGGPAQRIERHRRRADSAGGSLRWHVDYLLAHRYGRLVAVEQFPSVEECVLSRETAALAGCSVPVVGFGASDCRAGCAAHLYVLAPGSGLTPRTANL